MKTVHEQLSAQYFRWELRGRGWFTYPQPVALEPPFEYFPGYHLSDSHIFDDARRSSVTERILGKIGNWISPKIDPAPPHEEPEREVAEWSRSECVELAITFPKVKRFSREHMESFLRMCRSCTAPISFEILADASEIGFQWVCSREDAGLLKVQTETHFVGYTIQERPNQLVGHWDQSGQNYAVAEIGLGRDFLLSIGAGKSDFLNGLLASMSVFEEAEMGLFQLIFEPAQNPWGDSMVQAATKPDGSAMFRNCPDLPREAATKARSPLFAVVIRLVTCAASSDRAWALLAPMIVALNALGRPEGNHLVPLAMADYPAEAQEEDILRRQSHRWGMLLSLDELLSIIRFPNEDISSKRIRHDGGKTRAASHLPKEGLFLGWNEHLGMRTPAMLTPEQRVRHMHVIGGTGTGKTTFLLNLILQDIKAGHGFALLDPHGDLVDRLLACVPPHRINDVVLIDAGDEEFSVGFNILNAKADYEKTLLASDLVGVFQRLSTSWGDQMAVVLRNAILAFLERPEGGTLADVQRFLLEPDFRSKVLETVNDPDVVYYWRKGFPLLGGSKSIGPVLTRLQTFLSPKPIRYMVNQRESKLDIGEVMDSGKILLAKLPLGLMGAENSYLLGSLLVSKIQQAAMARQRMPEYQRRLFTLYVDEFQNFITPSMAEILSGTRKYRLSLVLAHQELEQLGRNDAVGSAVRANAGTRVVFRVGDHDARELAKGFSHFEAEALQNLSVGEAIVRVERSDNDFNLSVPPFALMDDDRAEANRAEVIARSRAQYARARDDIEFEDRQRHLAEEELPKAKPVPRRVKEINVPETSIQPPIVEEFAAPQTLAQISAEPPQPKYQTTTIRADLEELGRGGEIHKAAQAEFKILAERRGFRATIERQLPDSLDTVDLYLERDGTVIACEVNVTNTLEYELRNINKCLRAGVPLVAVLALDPDKHARLSAAIDTQLTVDQKARVKCLMKEDFEAMLDAFQPVAQPTSPTEVPPRSQTKMVKGWKVRTNAIPTAEQDISDVEKELAATLGENLRRRKAKKKGEK